MAKIGKKRRKKASSVTLSNEEIDSLKRSVEAIESVKQKHGLSYGDILGLLKEEKERIPVTIFNKKLSPLESISRYLKDCLGLNYHEIALLLARDERNIWHSYNDSLKKHPERLTAEKTRFFVPLKIFAEKRSSILESIVVHLKDEYSLGYRQISALINRDERTVWTAFSRAAKKLERTKSSSQNGL